MNFFEHQDAARRRTWRLVGLFLLAVAGIVVAVYLAFVLTAFGANVKTGSNIPFFDPALFAAVAGVTVAIVALGTGYKILDLSAGGAAIACALGGKKIPRTTMDPESRKLLHVVEEMAIASGCRVPEVYILEEPSINAFAAGFSVDDAVIGVTRGAVNRLTRDELQGVVAHEFSHILNGDMNLNLKLVGVLHGILLIGMIGYWLLRSAAYSGGGRRRDGKGAAILLFGLALFAIGFIGVFFGRLIQAAICREREFLADASAVQFTRNPLGIGGALKKIAGTKAGARIEHAAAGEAAHMFFGQAVAMTLGGLLATHPPIEERIRRVMAGVAPEGVAPEGGTPGPGRKTRTAADSAEPAATAPPKTKEEAKEFLRERLAPVLAAAGAGAGAGAAGAAGAGTMGRIQARSDEVLSSVGTIDDGRIAYAETVLEAIPKELREACDDPLDATAVLYALLLDEDETIRAKQFEEIASRAGKPAADQTRRLAPEVTRTGTALRLPLADLALASVRDLSPAQRAAFRRTIAALAAADETLSLFEFTLERMILRRLDLDEEPPPATAAPEAPAAAPEAPAAGLRRAQLASDASVLLSVVAHMGHWEDARNEAAFRAGLAKSGAPLSFLPLAECTYQRIGEALDRLRNTPPKYKEKLTAALVTTVTYDGTVTVEEAEILRAIADGLGVPVPPIVPGNLGESAQGGI